jgi:hypothetical protein
MTFDMTTEAFLKAQQKAETEEEFQDRVIELAHVHGWRVAHFRPVRIQRANGTVYYETPVAADGAGWPDCCLVRERVIWAELKRQNGALQPNQREWREALLGAGAEWYCWRPSDLDEIERVLR